MTNYYEITDKGIDLVIRDRDISGLKDVIMEHGINNLYVYVDVDNVYVRSIKGVLYVNGLDIKGWMGLKLVNGVNISNCNICGVQYSSFGVSGDFIITKSNITNLIGMVSSVGGDMMISECVINSMRGISSVVCGDLVIKGNKIKNLDDMVDRVYGNMYLLNNEIDNISIRRVYVDKSVKYEGVSDDMKVKLNKYIVSGYGGE